MNEITHISFMYLFVTDFQKANLWFCLESVMSCLDLCSTLNVQKNLDKAPAKETLAYFLSLSLC